MQPELNLDPILIKRVSTRDLLTKLREGEFIVVRVSAEKSVRFSRECARDGYSPQEVLFKFISKYTGNRIDADIVV